MVGGDQKTWNTDNMLSFAQQNLKYSQQTGENPRVFHSDFSLVCCEYLLILLRGSQIFACTEEIKTTLPPVGEYSDEECLFTMFSGELG